MFTGGSFRVVTSLLLTFALLLSTTPVSAADFSTNASLGSVSGVGSVQVRGVLVNQEGTLFPGDRVRTGGKSYAKVLLLNGNKLELSSDTEFVVNKNGQNISVGLSTGTLAFTASKTPVTITIGNYEVVPKAGSGGNIAFIGSEAAGVRMMTGSVVLRHLTTKKSVVVSEGTQRFITLNTDQIGAPIAQLASAAPTPLPAVPAMPQATPSGMSRTTWIAVLATIAGAATAVAVLATRGDDDDGDAAATLAKQRALAQAQLVATSAQQAATTATQTATAAGTVAAAASVPAALRAQAASLQSSATATAAQIATLNTQLAQLQSQSAGATGAGVTQIQDQIETVRRNLNSQIVTLNAAITQLNAIIASNPVPGVTAITPVQQVASPS